MKSTAADVPAYIAEVPAERQAAIKKLRTLCRKIFAGHEECLDYGMPCYKRDGVIRAAFASQKGYIALYGCGKVLTPEMKAKLTGANCGKGCIRFANPKNMDFAVIEELLRGKAAA